MIKIVTIAALAGNLIISFFVSYHLFYLMVSLFVRMGNVLYSDDERELANHFHKFCVIIPAHNEELLIGGLIDSIRAASYPKELCEIYVVADNCTDSTVQRVKEKSAVCFERKDLEKRGKPYALNWILRRINLKEFDAFIIIDADTVVHRDFFQGMNERLNCGDDVVQGYFGIMNPNETWLTRLMVIPGVLKYKLKYFGKRYLKLSCPLMGNGMCFKREVFEKYGWDAFSITENWEYYAKLILRGHITSYSEGAFIYSQTAKSLKQGQTQRLRWAKGRLETSIKYLLPLIWKGLRERNFVKLDAAVELVLPSHSMLFNSTFLMALIALILGTMVDSYRLFLWALSLGIIQIVFFLAGIILNKSDYKTWLALLIAPIFLLWKFWITFTGYFTYKKRSWVKTERHISSHTPSR